jgi:hypothetical protein
MNACGLPARQARAKFRLYVTWILHGSEAFICKALKGKAIVAYAEPLIIRLRRTDESLRLALRVKINEIKSTIILSTNWVFCFTSQCGAIC